MLREGFGVAGEEEEWREGNLAHLDGVYEVCPVCL